jgi:hypothetical protein
MSKDTLGEIITETLIESFPTTFHLLSLDKDKQILVAECIEAKIQEYDPTATP